MSALQGFVHLGQTLFKERKVTHKVTKISDSSCRTREIRPDPEWLREGLREEVTLAEHSVTRNLPNPNFEQEIFTQGRRHRAHVWASERGLGVTWEAAESKSSWRR